MRRSVTRFGTLTAFCLAAVLGISPLFAAGATEYKVYLKKLELKNHDGRWMTVIEPDRAADLVEEEAKISFFNSAGRVPDGNYINFRLTFEEAEGKRATRIISRKWDIPEPVAVRKGSFIYALAIPVLGGSPLEFRSVERVRLTVDERSTDMAADEILIEVPKEGA